ncbi:MAG TPA: type II toxin-antitoxin system VapC family toxin [Bryobacteraceae bacterium]|nr:type II toxin-antitoxin system VapC family toxin [Bryobacteraceae bacterium]
MVIDTSAILAIFLDEPEAPLFELAIESDSNRLISIASVLEAAIVLGTRFGETGERELDLFMHKAKLQPMAVTEQQAELGRLAYRNYGKGRHRAGLNFGDCFSYALSKTSGEPLLFKGDDFAGTDVEPVTLPPG